MYTEREQVLEFFCSLQVRYIPITPEFQNAIGIGINSSLPVKKNSDESFINLTEVFDLFFTFNLLL
jgi:hypothetical protein